MQVRLFGRKPWALMDIAAGIHRHGDTWLYRDFKDHALEHYGIDCDAVFIMGWVPEADEFGAYYRAHVPVFYVTDGYVARRRYDLKGPDNYGPDAHFGVSMEWPGGYGKFDYGPHPSDRWSMLGVPVPTMRPIGSDILIGFQETNDIYEQSRNPFFKNVVNFVYTLQDKNIRMRVHPRFDSRVDVTKTVIYGFQGRVTRADEETLERDIDGSYCLITYDSNVAVEAALLGYPAVEYGRSMAHPIVTSWHHFKTHGGALVVPTDDQLKAWCHWLAYQQWTRDEMATGHTWDYIKKRLLKCV